MDIGGAIDMLPGRRVLVVIALALLAACASRGAVSDPAVLAQLGFLNGPDVTRAYVEARLGLPSETFEGGSVTSYRLYMVNGRLTTFFDRAMSARYALLLHYDADGRLARHALARQ